MVVTITQWVLRISALIALILGILFWTGNSAPDALIPVHITLGILVTLSLWVLGFMFGRARGGNWRFALLPIAWGLTCNWSWGFTNRTCQTPVQHCQESFIY